MDIKSTINMAKPFLPKGIKDKLDGNLCQALEIASKYGNTPDGLKQVANELGGDKLKKAIELANTPMGKMVMKMAGLDGKMDEALKIINGGITPAKTVGPVPKTANSPQLNAMRDKLKNLR